MMLTLEDGWSEIADGLHVHRHFLEVAPALDVRAQRMYQSLIDRTGIELPALFMKPENVFHALLEHLCHPFNATREFKVPAAFQLWRASSDFGGHPTLFVNSSLCWRTDSGGYVINGDALSDAPDLLAPDFQRRIEQLVDGASLKFLISLNVSIIVHYDMPAIASGPGSVESSFDATCDFSSTVFLNKSAPAMVYAEDLVAQAASRWFYAFLLARDDPAPPKPQEWHSPWAAQPLDTISHGANLLAKCVRLRFCDRLSHNQSLTLSQTERSTCRERAEILRCQLNPAQEFVDSIEEILRNPERDIQVPFNNMDVGDLLRTFLPGERQFQKYWHGTGAGQSE